MDIYESPKSIFSNFLSDFCSKTWKAVAAVRACLKYMLLLFIKRNMNINSITCIL